MKQIKVKGFEEAISQFTEVVLRDSEDVNVAVGPAVWEIAEGHDVRHWYFCVGNTYPNGEFRLNQLKIDYPDKNLAEDTRQRFITGLLVRKPPMVVHSFDDELAMMRFCEAVWPSDRTRELMYQIERERAA